MKQDVSRAGKISVKQVSEELGEAFDDNSPDNFSYDVYCYVKPTDSVEVVLKRIDKWFMAKKAATEKEISGEMSINWLGKKIGSQYDPQIFFKLFTRFNNGYRSFSTFATRHQKSEEKLATLTLPKQELILSSI